MRSGLAYWNSLSVRARLILVFAIRVVAWVLLVWIAWNQMLEAAGDTVNVRDRDVLDVASLPSDEAGDGKGQAAHLLV
jgi:hypothetical protein